MTPKERVLNFAKVTEHNAEYKFEIDGDLLAAMAFVSAMRSALSRMREAIKKQGGKTRAFTMKELKPEIGPPGKVTITLKLIDKSIAVDADLEELQALLEDGNGIS